MEELETNQIPFEQVSAAHCPFCLGDEARESKNCPHKKGDSVGAWLNGRFFYWGKRVDSLVIFEDRLQKVVHLFLNGIALAVGTIGLVLFFITMQTVYLKTGTLENFWTFKSPGMFAFWISLIADMYIFFKIDRTLSRYEKVEKGSRFDLPEVQDFPKLRKLEKDKKVDVAKSFSPEALDAVENAFLLAEKLDSRRVAPAHLMGSLINFNRINLIMGRLGLDFSKFIPKLRHMLGGVEEGSPPLMAPGLKEILVWAYLHARRERRGKVDLTDLFVSLGIVDSPIKELLYDFKIDRTKLEHVAEWFHLQNELYQKYRRYRSKAAFKPKTEVNRAYTAIATPILDRFSEDLTARARAGALPMTVGREGEIEQIYGLLQAGKNAICLVGNPGVGRSAIVFGIAQDMVSEDVPPVLQDKRFVALSIPSLVAGASASGAIEQRLQDLLTELRRSGNIVLFIDDIQNMIGVGTESGESLDISSLLAEAISGGHVTIISVTTPEDWRKYLERSSIGQILERVNVAEVAVDNAIRILEAKAPFIEGKNKIYLTYPALEAAVELSGRYVHDKFLPLKAIELVEETAEAVLRKKGEKALVGEQDVAETISEKTKIPATLVSAEESEKLLGLEAKIHERIIGQDEAVTLVAAALRRARTELRDEDRPISTFLFLGPTGVGKTEVAKTVAATYFGSEENMVRLDMSEYNGPDAINKLIGFKGASEGGFLTENLRNNPFSLVLLDEFEKAHPDVMNIFLQVFDDGRLTDSVGRTIDFTNAIIVGTSNAGTQLIHDEIKAGESLENIRNKLIEQELKKHFKPELINRFDGVVVFKPLTPDQVYKITELLLAEVTARLHAKGIELAYGHGVVQELADLGFSPTYGARPLRRVIQDTVENTLANYLLEGKLQRRDKAVLKEGGQIEVVKAREL